MTLPTIKIGENGAARLEFMKQYEKREKTK